ncbi:hypothetical protein J2Z53_001394 [Clostridium moniliforme]|uniref:Uncharacterized protein n=1 Tax=Clostridium moniliforme TaxID=39489 RepID=A0ABS4F0M9_9CLOT|nr:hypothetical protein [Clostridium moniliforme]MBP1889811.1 hypothetical protein [Clostridium moniliforme]
MSKKHGLRYTKLYGVWGMMKQRCYNCCNKDYKDYGAREIRICDEWKNNVKIFYNWAINNGYEEGLTLDRINPNGNYEPNNCRWITNAEQQNNKRNTIHVLYKDKLLTLTELSNITNIKRETLEMRYIRGDRGERLIRPVRKRCA